MIITEQKAFAELLSLLERHQSVFVVGCGVCATTWRTGGEPEVKALLSELSAAGKQSTGWTITAEACCDARLTRRILKQSSTALKITDAIVVMACGAGTQTVASLVELPVYPGLNTIGLSQIQSLSLALERCRLCGDCMLAETAGICPVARCPKGLMNGPCGGYQDGKCEVDRTQDCAWVLIYERLQTLGQEARLAIISEPKDWSRMRSPRVADKKAAQLAAKE
ncbi:MAG: 5,10-methylenetetrahydrofolate reductase [Chloroflexi bacterium HGW-Chloroflexi-1]|nr:MAG: 5,10-methylenetetrahydrofolate reductase [Chloroflexi bacterium HGW-Chloroflexi-1]